MTARTPRRSVAADFWQARRRQARAFLQAAQQAVLLAERGQSCNPAISQMVFAAIAYGDCLTARRAQVVNQQDHAAAPRLLRDVLRDSLPDAQERRYRRILGYKDEVQYGVRAATLNEAKRLLSELEAFCQWAEEQLAS